MKTGQNIKDIDRSFQTYMKNCCVALLSARSNVSQDADVALVTNCEVPEPYRTLLVENGVLIFKCEFDSFRFPDDYAWGLAFYKLCALKYVVDKLLYDDVAFIDSDCYVQRDFDLVWKECEKAILLLDIKNQLNSPPVVEILSYIDRFEKNKNGILTRYGGEFFAANRHNATLFIRECEDIFNTMNAHSFVTKHGDEFISTIAAYKFSSIVKNAGAYVFRFWTRLIRTTEDNYMKYPVLHLPAEKEHGIIKIFDRYYSKGKQPSAKVVRKLLHLTYPSLSVAVYRRLQYMFDGADLLQLYKTVRGR